MDHAAPSQDLQEEAALQLDGSGNLRHLLTLKNLDRSLLIDMLDDAERYLTRAGEKPARSDLLAGRTVGNLFFEPSTRTRASFDLAAKRLGADVLNLDVNTSSRKKGESILDTIYTLQAMQIDVMVIRDASAGVPAFIARHVQDHVSILNAGEADVSHPTQGLLDLLTIRQHKGRFDDLIITIVGDIRHSRVAMSISHGLATLGVGELRLVSPPTLAPDPESVPGAMITSDLQQGLDGADVVMALRIQRERIGNLDGIPSIDEYFASLGISQEHLAWAAPDAIVMHPGPMNRGIEIESAVADGPQSVIEQQVTNGVAVRMAVLDRVGSPHGGSMTTAAQQAAQKNRGTIFVEDGEVISSTAFPGEQFIMRVRAPKCAAAAKPGSFAHITCDESLPMRRPLSIMRANEDWIEVLYKTVGSGLRHLSRKGPGDTISVLGPIGQPFVVSPERPNTVLIGGGVGIPPMVFLADRLRTEYSACRPLAILGSEIPFPFDLVRSRLPTPWLADGINSTMPLLESWNIPCRLATLSGFDGCFDGFVTDLTERWLGTLSAEELGEVELFACGPTPMLRAVAELAARYELPCQVSLEEFMACAVGGCAGCTLPINTPEGLAMKRVCVDGPVFDAATVVWDY